MSISVTIVVAIISAAAVLFAPALSFFLTKQKEREAEWRTQKFEHYKVFMAALNALVGPPASFDERVRFADAANNIFLVGSKDVLVALRDFLRSTADGRTEVDRRLHDERLTALIVAIRRDLRIKGPPLPQDYQFGLWSGKSG